MDAHPVQPRDLDWDGWAAYASSGRAATSPTRASHAGSNRGGSAGPPVVACGAFATWIWRREGMTTPRLATMCIVGLEGATLIGPYVRDLFKTWERAQALYLVLYSALIALQARAIWGSSASSSR